MSWKVHGTNEVFAALRGLCSNSYRMYDPCEHRCYYDHDCDVYECVVEDAAREYERLLEHCEKQREELAAIKNPLGKLKESFGGDMDNIDGGTEVERIEGSSKVRAGSSITDELREYARENECESYCKLLFAIADRIDERHSVKVERLEKYRAAVDAMLKEYVELPVDADGVPIHVGDELTNGEDLPAKVRCMVLDESGWMVSTRELRGYGVPPATLRHVQPDSWESIIEDAANFALDTQHTAGRISLEPFVERCRRLAGERP